MGTGCERERKRGRGWRPVDEHRMGSGTEAGTETRVVEEMGTRKRVGAETGARIGSGRAARKCKKPHKSCERHVRNGGDLGGKRKKCRKERVGPVAANPDNLENNKEAGGGEQGT